MREPFSIALTCFRPLLIAGRAVRQASRSVQSIRGPETWAWVERTAWASNLLEAVRNNFDLKPGHFQEGRRPNVCIVEYNDGTKAAVISGEGVGWTYAGEIEGQKEPTIVSMLGFPGPISQYHASNAL